MLGCTLSLYNVKDSYMFEECWRCAVVLKGSAGFVPMPGGCFHLHPDIRRIDSTLISAGILQDFLEVSLQG